MKHVRILSHGGICIYTYICAYVCVYHVLATSCSAMVIPIHTHTMSHNHLMWHGHTCSHVNCFPGLSLGGRSVHCKLHPTQFQSMAAWHICSHSCVPGSYHSIMCPWFRTELCPKAITYRHEHACSHTCHVPSPSCGGVGMLVFMYAMSQHHPVGEGHACSHASCVPALSCGGTGMNFHLCTMFQCCTMAVCGHVFICDVLTPTCDYMYMHVHTKIYTLAPSLASWVRVHM